MRRWMWIFFNSHDQTKTQASSAFPAVLFIALAGLFN